MDEKTATEIKRIGPLNVLKSGLKTGLITQSEFDEHQSLARDLHTSDYPELAHKRMVEILEKCYTGV